MLKTELVSHEKTWENTNMYCCECQSVKTIYANYVIYLAKQNHGQKTDSEASRRWGKGELIGKV